MKKDYTEGAPAFEEAVAEDWERQAETVEVPLGHRPLVHAWFLVLALALIFCGRIAFLSGGGTGVVYAARAKANLEQVKRTNPLRGIITDRYGTVLAENAIAPHVFLETREFLKQKELQAPTLEALRVIAGIAPEEVWGWIRDVAPDRLGERIPVPIETNEQMLVALKGLDLRTLTVEDGVERVYPKGRAFSHVVGYVGFPSKGDLEENPRLGAHEMVGKDGVERSYDEVLRGDAGITVVRRNALGAVLDESERQVASRGETLQLTIDAELQSYFWNRLRAQLRALGRAEGVAVGIAMAPQTGEILALVQEPSYDNNVLSKSGRTAEKKELLTSKGKPLFNRAVSGLYSPGSTVKPLVGVAALKEGVIDAEREIFSPGYLDIPNPFDPSKPTRYNDWRYHGYVDLSAAIAVSSDVYFYEVGGGAPEGPSGLGIGRLRKWWQEFNFGALTGIDLPGEAEGFLPSIEWKQKRERRPWLLGDTYNVSIGQGDLLTTPLQLVAYLNVFATGGKLLRPVVAMGAPHPEVRKDLTELAPEIAEAVKGMREAVTSPKGTVHALHDLPFTVAAKTGSAQVYYNRKVNAFFVGYAPVENPQIIVFVLIEDAKEGGLNAIPVGGDVLEWYYKNRMQKQTNNQ
jgi:penicillin-binding protein 2